MDDGFALPAVEDEVGNLSTLQPLHQDITRGNRATAGIDKQGTAHASREESLIDHPGRGILPRTCQRDMQRDDVALLQDGLQRDKAFSPLALGTRRVAEQGAQAQGSHTLRQSTTYIPHPDNANRLPLQGDATHQRPAHQRREDVLHHAPSIASWSILPANTSSPTVVGVDVVKAGGRRGNELHVTPL